MKVNSFIGQLLQLGVVLRFTQAYRCEMAGNFGFSVSNVHASFSFKICMIQLFRSEDGLT